MSAALIQIQLDPSAAPAGARFALGRVMASAQAIEALALGGLFSPFTVARQHQTTAAENKSGRWVSRWSSGGDVVLALTDPELQLTRLLVDGE